MKRNRITNTKGFAKKLFEEGFVEFTYTEFVAYAKYAHWEHNWNRDKIEKVIIEKCSQNTNFNLVLNYDTISKAVSKRKYALLEDIVSVNITKKEIDFFKNVPESYSKILFCILVMAKRDMPNYKDKLYYNYSLDDAIKISGISMNQKEKDAFNIYCGKNEFLIATYSSANNWFVGFNDTCDATSIIVIDKFDKIISFFPKWCEKCGNIFERTGRTQKMCKKCAIEKEKENVKNRVKKHREKCNDA